MICSSCGSENSENSRFCNQCGKNLPSQQVEDWQLAKVPAIDAVKLQNAPQREVKSAVSEPTVTRVPTKKNKTSGLLLVLLLISVLMIVGVAVGKPYFDYYNAGTLRDNGQYQQSIDMFTLLGDFRDADTQILQVKYLWGKQLFDQKKYVEAYDLFQELGHFQDSADLLLETQYLWANQHVESQEYEKAITLYKMLGNYKASAQRAVETSYSYALKQQKNGNYSAAVTLLNELGDYKDAKALLIQWQYDQALRDYYKGDFKKAQEELSALAGYQDSSKYLGYLEKLIALQGEWTPLGSEFRLLVFSRWKFYDVFFPGAHDTSVFDHEIVEAELANNPIALSGYIDDRFVFNGENIVHERRSSSSDQYQYENTYYKTSDDTTMPRERPSPRIGMTEQQVLDSNWGRPSKVNTTKTANGVHEQWVYFGNKYLYFEDGVLTTIQE